MRASLCVHYLAHTSPLPRPYLAHNSHSDLRNGVCPQHSLPPHLCANVREITINFLNATEPKANEIKEGVSKSYSGDCPQRTKRTKSMIKRGAEEVTVSISAIKVDDGKQLRIG